MNIKKFVAGITTLALMGTTMAFGSVFTASADIKDTYNFSLMGTVGDAQFWDNDAPVVEVTGDGSYSIELTFDKTTESKSGTGALIMSTDINAFDYDEGGVPAKTGINITIDSIKIDDKEIEYTGPSEGAYTLNDDGATLRYNIYNVWGNSVEDISFDFTVEKNIVVNFSVSGLDRDTPAVTTATDLVPGASNDNTTTSTSKVEDKVNYSLYNDIINKAGSTVSNNGYDAIHNNLGYYLFDINGDGVKELIIADSFESELNPDENTNYIWGYYDIYTIKDNKVVEIKQDLLEEGSKSLQIAQGTYLSLTVVDGKLAYVVLNPDDNTKAYAFVITGYTELEDGSLSLTGEIQTGDAKDFSELELYNYTDKTVLNELTGSKNNNNTNTKTTTSTKKTDSPATGDAGLGAVAVAFGAAGLSAFVLRKKD